MASQINNIYDSLLKDIPITIQFPTRQDFNCFHAQLRTIKSRYDKKFLEAFSESLSRGRVIRCKEIPNSTELSKSNNGNGAVSVEFSLSSPKRRSKIQFTILTATSMDIDNSVK